MKLLKSQGSSPTSQVLLPRNVTRNSEGWVCKVWNSRGFCGNLIKSPSSFPTHTPPSPIPTLLPTLSADSSSQRGLENYPLEKMIHPERKCPSTDDWEYNKKPDLCMFTKEKKVQVDKSDYYHRKNVLLVPCSCMNGNPEQISLWPLAQLSI